MFDYWQGKEIFPFSENVHTSYGAHSPSYLVGVAMSRAISVLPLYVFMTWIATTFIPDIWFGRSM
jgi:hypothetical protein